MSVSHREPRSTERAELQARSSPCQSLLGRFTSHALRLTKAPIKETQEILFPAVPVIRIESTIIPDNPDEIASVSQRQTREYDNTINSHIDQDDDGEPPGRTPQPSLVQERLDLDHVKDDKQGQGDDEDPGGEHVPEDANVPIRLALQRGGQDPGDDVDYPAPVPVDQHGETPSTDNIRSDSQRLAQIAPRLSVKCTSLR